MAVMLAGYLASGWVARKLQRPVQMKSIAEVERRAFRGRIPTVELQRRLYANRRVGWWSVPISAVYLSHFVVPYACAAWLHRNDRERWRRWNRTFALLNLAGLATYVALPSAPPWMASEEGVIEPVERTSGDGLELLGLRHIERVLELGRQGTNEVAAIPSIHSAHALLVPLFFSGLPPWARAALALYPAAMGATLVVTAEHYVLDVALGFGYTIAAYALTAD